MCPSLESMGDIIQFTVSLCYNDIEEPTDFESISFFFQQNPVVYVIPMESVLGKLSLFPAGITGTIPFESTASNWAECEALVERYYPCSGHCCRVWHLNVFASKSTLSFDPKYLWCCTSGV